MKNLFLWLLGPVLMISACTQKPVVQNGDVERLAVEIQALGPQVDPAEAIRAAELAYGYPQQLAREYNVTDAAIIHNAKVINGFRDRGLCNDWTEDMLARLRQENFRTLSFHWATSPPTPWRIIHHSAVISAKGEALNDGIILDPWRYGGTLFWSQTPADDRYDWRPRLEVREELLRDS